MADAADVMGFLRPNGDYVLVGNDYEGITFGDNCEPLTKEEFAAGFEQYAKWKNDKEIAKIAAKSAAQEKLSKLGLTLDDLTALGLN